MKNCHVKKILLPQLELTEVATEKDPDATAVIIPSPSEDASDMYFVKPKVIAARQSMQEDRGHTVRDERAEEYFAWKGNRSANDFVGYIKNVRGEFKLSHSGILKDSGISESLARSNPHIRQDLFGMEQQLRDNGYLPNVEKQAATDSLSISTPAKQARSIRDKKRIVQLEQALATVRLERDDLKEAIRRYDLLDKYLSDTMRMPR